jgi:hypothetical protein
MSPGFMQLPAMLRTGSLALALSLASLLGVGSARAENARHPRSLALSNPRSHAGELSRPQHESQAASASRTIEHHRSAQQDTADEPERSSNPMAPFGIGLQLGVAGTGAGSAVVDTCAFSMCGRYQGHTERRVGLHLAVPIYLGGRGFGWVFTPMLQRSDVQHFTKDPLGNVTGQASVSLVGFGGYTGPQVQIHALRALYVGLGIGAKIMYLRNNAFDYALDLYGRIPVSATYYVRDQLGLVMEMGFGYGASAFADAPRVMIDPVTRTAKNVKDDPQFGYAFAWDLSFGVRLP